MLKINNRLNRGDTLIEVLFAVAVFSLVAVGSLSIMNQGTATSQRALEITLVRQEMNAQAETLRFLNKSYLTSPDGTQGIQWTAIDNAIAGNVHVTHFGAGASCPTPVSPIPTTSFFLNTKTAKFVPAAGKYRQASTYSQVSYDAGGPYADGIWIEAVRVKPAGPLQDHAGYIDFHIRACWDSPGQAVPVTLGTIVRLYEPN